MPYRIMVVDDSKLARMAFAKSLNTVRPDWTRVEATNAAEALELAKQGSVDLAVLDFNMPERDGLHLAADLRALKPQMPLAVISANHQKEIVERAHVVDATFLAKPITDAALREFLEHAEAQLKAQKS